MYCFYWWWRCGGGLVDVMVVEGIVTGGDVGVWWLVADPVTALSLYYARLALAVASHSRTRTGKDFSAGERRQISHPLLRSNNIFFFSSDNWIMSKIAWKLFSSWIRCFVATDSLSLSCPENLGSLSQSSFHSQDQSLCLVSRFYQKKGDLGIIGIIRAFESNARSFSWNIHWS